ncbi:MAG: DUF4142 domain-containing protein [Burkholderiales bacterium]|nr:DUF4142 domain-containing protein [Burkholderiales bacterium]
MIAVLVSALCLPAAMAQEGVDAPRTAPPDTTQQSPVTDRAFILNAAQATMAEIEMGEMAKRRSPRADVQQFATAVVVDHRALRKALWSMAVRKRIPLPDEMDAIQHRLATSLSRASGAGFDTLYLNDAGVAVRQRTKALFEAAMASGDPEIAAFARDAAVIVQRHLDTARQLAEVGGEPVGPSGARSPFPAAAGPVGIAG